MYENDLRLVADLNPSTGEVKSRYVYVSQSHSPDFMIRDGESYQFVKDHLGSVKLVVKVSDGSVVQNITYDEFGRILTDSNPGFQPFGFAGGVYDYQASLTKFGVRDYDPEVGRWLTKDPILFNGGDANLYGYVLMDPVNLVDPYGLSGDRIKRSRDWLNKNHPGLDRRKPNIWDFPLWPGTEGLTLPCNNIVLDTNKLNDEELVEMMAHEFMHNNDGFWRTITGGGRSHDAIRDKSHEIRKDFYDKQP